MKEDNFEYNEDLDILYIYNNDEIEDVEGSIVFGNIVYDIGKSGKVVGLEIDNASRILEVNPQLLNSIRNAELKVSVQRNMIFITFFISLANKVFNFSYVIPQKKIPITC